MKIYNTLKRQKEEFKPLKKGAVGMYVCGPTVYDEPHIGHARSAYVFDIVRRYFKYKGYKVNFVRNVTDVDDKIIEKAKHTKDQRPKTKDLKVAVKEISEKYLKTYHDAMEKLGILKPTKEPKATEYIGKMIKFIEKLIKLDRAYVSGGDVYFNIKKAKGYGKLSGQNLENLEAGARISPGENKKDPLDFALWKKAKDEEPSWKSPWGDGRPGWHIECSVMSSDILGGEFDIHAGGIDLIFPHHENEIAQSEGAGNKFARFWIHNGLLAINGEKMAKSLGNFITISGFIAKYKDPDLLKLLFIASHYRHPVDYTEEKIEEMARMKERILIFLDAANKRSEDRGQRTEDRGEKNPKINKLKEKFIDAMEDDFNTPEALAAIFDLVTLGNTCVSENNINGAKKIGKLLKELCDVFALRPEKTDKVDKEFEKEIKALVKERNAARQKKDFKKADGIRDALLKKGIILEDAKEGTVWRKKI